MSASPSSCAVESGVDGGDATRFQHNWRWFQRVYKRRRAFFAGDEQPKSKSTQRLFILSRNDDPWEIFGLPTRLEYCRRVFEWSGLHFSALHEACADGDKTRVRQILALGQNEGADCRLLARDSSGRTPLHHAVIREHHGVIRLLLRHSDARLQLHVRDNRGAPPVQYVLEKMCRLAQQLPASSSIPVRAARAFGASKRFQKLWQLADRIMGSMEPGFSQELRCLDFKVRGDAWDAVRTGNVDRLRLIYEVYGQDLSDDLPELQYSLLHEACSRTQNDLSVILYLISDQRLDRTKRDQSGSTPLNSAAARGWLEACILLLEEDVPDVEVDPEELLLMVDYRGRTPLHACLYFMGRRGQDDVGSQSDAVRTARFLLERCPQVLHVVDCDGFTPLHYAIRCGDLSLVNLMISLGASLYHEVRSVLPKGEYGVRASWAPCGTRLRRKRGQLPITTRSSEQHNPAAELILPGTPSVACERMHQVKAGHVEHPGEVVPMETLWFLVKRRPNCNQVRLPDEIPIANVHPVVEETTKSLEASDLGHYGCRRFGAICESCQCIPGDDSESTTATLSRENQENIVVISPLHLAVRCCRLSVEEYQHLNGRMEIVEALLLAGSVVDDSVINEALRACQLPRLIKIVVLHSGRQLTHDDIVNNFFCPTNDIISSVDPRQSMLMGLLETYPECFDHTLLPALFRWGYFKAVHRMFEIDSSRVENLMEGINAISPLTGGSHKPYRHPELTTSHLDQLMRWKSTWPNRSRELTLLGCKCVDALLHRRTIKGGCARHQTDLAIATALRVCSAEGSAISGSEIVKWMIKALEKGLPETTRVLRPIIESTPELSSNFMRSLPWPIRGLHVQLDFVDEFAQALTPAILAIEGNRVESETLALCLAVSCIYRTPLGTIRHILANLKGPEQALGVMKTLVSRRFGGHTLPIWIVRNGRVDIAELLLTEFETIADSGDDLWCAFTLAALVSTTVSGGWDALLLSGLPTPSRRSWLSKRLVRIHNPSTHLSAAVDWLTTSADTNSPRNLGWAEGTTVMQEMARWNALPMMQQLIAFQSDDVTTALARLSTQRDDADGCTPVELCELLGYRELARLMERPTSNRVPSQDTDNSWLPVRRTHFGLLRTVLSSSVTNARTHQLSARASKINQLQALSGDWTAAVALNDLRLLEAFSLHGIPLTADESSISSSDAMVTLLKTAISHGSLEAIEWLASKQLSRVVMPASCTTEVLFTAARHTSAAHARMTLLLLQQPGFDPGRLAGDGTDVTLLHRAACFSDSELACSILEILLAVDGSDVNVRDGFGFMPIAYALASGNLSTACFLVTRCANARLEAEFEGQNAFYYTLQLLPSFAWRWILQTLLATKREAAFLHCMGDDCVCKGFERVHDTSRTLSTPDECSFCGHTLEMHTRVPFPPWFRDQYETYLDPEPKAQDDHNADDEDDNDEDDDEAASRRRLRALLDTPLADEATLERDRGRLRTRDLERITRLRFHGLLSTLALELPSPQDPDPEAHDHEATRGDPGEEDALRKLPADVSVDSHANLEAPEAAESSIESAGDAPSSRAHPAPRRSRAPSLQAPQGEASMSRSLLPWSEVAVGPMGFPTTRAEQIHSVLRRWLASTQNRSGSQSDRAPSPPPQTVQEVFARWRDVTMTATSTCVSFHGAVPPVAFDASRSVPRPQPPPTAGQREEEEEQREVRSSLCSSPGSSSSSPETTWGTSTPSPPAIGSTHANKSLSILHLFLHHWRYARVYQCFRLWKRRCVNVNSQVALQELETLAETWAADARRVRFQELLARQRALEVAIRERREE